jgi:hypothetical protein
MIEAEWNSCEDAGAMIDYVWRHFGGSTDYSDLLSGDDQRGDPPNDALVGLGRVLHRFYVASCRRIWKLLPHEASRRGVELAERFLAGEVSADEINTYNYHVEGAAFCIDYNTAPEDIQRWVAEVRALPADELRSMLHLNQGDEDIEPRELLERAAYFVDYATYSSPKRPPPPCYRLFLSAAELRQHVSYPRSS